MFIPAHLVVLLFKMITTPRPSHQDNTGVGLGGLQSFMYRNLSRCAGMFPELNLHRHALSGHSGNACSKNSLTRQISATNIQLPL